MSEPQSTLVYFAQATPWWPNFRRIVAEPLVGAWSVGNHLALGQVATDDKSNEITAISELLRMLDLKGAIVTIAKQIVDAGGDYALAVKNNHPQLAAALRDEFIKVLQTPQPSSTRKTFFFFSCESSLQLGLPTTAQTHPQAASRQTRQRDHRPATKH